MRRFLDQPIWVRVLRGILLAVLVAAAAFYTPTPYVLEAPGRAVSASSIVSVQDPQARPINGEYLMTTVLHEKASVMLCIYGFLDPQATLTKETPVTSGLKAQSPNDDGRQMELSQYLSTRVALEALGYETYGEYRGLSVLDLAPNSPNLGILQPGDTLVGLEQHRPPTFEDFRSLLAGKSVDDTLAATVVRQGRELPLRIALTQSDGRIRIGAILRQEYEGIALPVKVVFRSGNTSGASAGLVFALEIYDQLSSEDLAQGRVVAATGTLDGDGTVGPIEGLALKLVAAERAGADVFVVPRENWEEIQNVATTVKVIPVATFQEAIHALR